MTVRFVTGNEHKVKEARERLDRPVEQVSYDYLEIQADDLTAIATAGLADARNHLDTDGPLIVEDSGLFVTCLGGFPGPYSAYVESTIGIEAIWQLARELDDRSARFESVIAYADAEHHKLFRGSVSGEIVAPRGTGGFGYDPIFEVDGRTMAERSRAEKNALSHRGRALTAFAAWLEDHERGSASGPG